MIRDESLASYSSDCRVFIVRERAIITKRAQVGPDWPKLGQFLTVKGYAHISYLERVTCFYHVTRQIHKLVFRTTRVGGLEGARYKSGARTIELSFLSYLPSSI